MGEANMLHKKSHRKIQIGALLLACLFLSVLTGCGEQAMEVPTLETPMAINEYFRPVEYGDVGVVSVEYGALGSGRYAIGTVVAREDSYFWTTNVKVKEIFVKVGDHVSAGDELASVDVDEVKKQIAEQQELLALEQALYAQDEIIYASEHGQLEMMLASTITANNIEDTSHNMRSLSLLEENHEYEEKLHGLKVSRINAEISQLRKLTEDACLVAKTDGVVTFTKDLKKTTYVDSSDSVVTIADTSDCYLEMSGCTVSSEDRRYMSQYDKYYTKIGEKRYELIPYDYTPQETSVFENKGIYPCMRFKFEDENAMPALGSGVMVYLSQKVKENVLIIGNDSVYHDSDGEFVYVKENGEKNMRRIETGKHGAYYCEVVSGLSEGELVYHTSATSLLGEYDTMEIKLSDFVEKIDAVGVQTLDTQKRFHYAPQEGVIVEAAVKEADEVKKGDLLYRLQINDGAAKIADLKNRMENMTKEYEKQRDEMMRSKQRLELEKCAADAVILAKALKEARQPLPDQGVAEVSEPGSEEAPQSAGGDGEPSLIEQMASEDPYLGRMLGEDLAQLECNLEKQRLQYEYDKKQLQKEYDKLIKDNDGNGLISVYAEWDGKIVECKAVPDLCVRENEKLICINEPTQRIISLNVFSGSILNMGQKVELYGETTHTTYEATVVGGPGACHNVYASEVDDRMYLTKKTPDSDGRQYMLSVDDPEAIAAEERIKPQIPYIDLAQTIVIPRGAISEEEINLDTYYYVWRLMEDGQQVKEYIMPIEMEDKTKAKICVLSGLKPGDVIAVKKEVLGKDADDEHTEN